MKKGVDKLFFIIIPLILISSAFAQTVDYNKLTEKEKEVYDYGKNIDEFFKLSGSAQEDIVDDNLDIFMTGFLSNPGNMEKLLESWFKSENNKFLLDDSSKNKLFQKLYEIDKDFTLKLANKALERIKKESPELAKYYQGLIEEINVDSNLLKELKWEGNKLGIAGEDGRLKGWIDFDKLPAFVKKIEYKTDNDGKAKFFVGVSDGKFGKTIKFSEGSLSPSPEGFIIGKDGERFGSKPYGIESISWNPKTKKIAVEYYDFNGDKQKFERDISFFKLDENDRIVGFLKESSDLKEKYPNLNFDEIVEKVKGTLKDAEKIKAIDDFMGKLGELEIKLPRSNQINLGYILRDKKNLNEVIEFSFNEKGGLDIKTSEGASVISTNSRGEPALGLIHQSITGKEMFLKFNKYGELEAVQNAEGIIFDEKGYEYLDFSVANDLAGVRITRSSLADAVSRGDVGKIIDLADDRITGSRLVERVIDKALVGESVDVQSEAIALLKEQLENPNLGPEAKNRISEAIDVFQENIRKSGDNIFASVFNDNVNREQLLQNPGFQYLAERTQEQTKQALNRLLTNPENIQTLLNYYKNPNAENAEKFNELVRNSLQYVEGYDSLFYSSFSESIADGIGKLSERETSPEVAKERVNSFINGLDFAELVRNGRSNNFQEELRIKLENRLTNLNIAEKEQILTAYDNFMSKVSTAIESEKVNFKASLKNDLIELGKSDYDTSVLIDVDLGEIVYTGKERVEIDTKVPLRSVSVNHAGRTPEEVKANSEDVFILKSNGNTVAWFDGDKTYAKRSGHGNIENIGSIINEKKYGHQLVVISDGKRYDIINPKDPSQVRSVINQYGNLHVTGFTGLQSLVNYVDITTHHLELKKNRAIGDIGEDLNAEMTLTIIGEASRTGATGLIFPNGPIAGIIDGIARKKAGEEFGQAISGAQSNKQKILSDMGLQLDNNINKFLTGIGNGDIQKGREVLKSRVEFGNDFLRFADNNNIDIPRRTLIEDSLKLGQMTLDGSLKNQLTGLADWAIEQDLRQGTRVKIVNEQNPYLQIGNNKYQSIDGSVLRSALRGADFFSDRIPSQFSARYGDENGFFVLIPGQGWKYFSRK